MKNNVYKTNILNILEININIYLYIYIYIILYAVHKETNIKGRKF